MNNMAAHEMSDGHTARTIERGRGKFSLGPVTFGGPNIAQKYEVHQNVPW